jgi:hypothetical protein
MLTTMRAIKGNIIDQSAIIQAPLRSKRSPSYATTFKCYMFAKRFVCHGLKSVALLEYPLALQIELDVKLLKGF